jgi:hypothetical protein
LSALEDAQDAADEEPWGARDKVALARQALEEAQAHADARARATLEGRGTEARVKAAVLADAEVQRLKRELIALENEMRSGPVRRPPADETPQERALRAQIAAAEEEAEQAQIDVEVARAKMEMYRILVLLVTG